MTLCFLVGLEIILDDSLLFWLDWKFF